jgi:hypothetical protein
VRLAQSWADYSHYGITGNAVAITRFRWEVRRRWQKWLNRPGGRSSMPWSRFAQLERRYPPPAAIRHPLHLPSGSDAMS